MDKTSPDYWAPRECLHKPIPELYEAAFVLEEAVSAHLHHDCERASRLFASTNTDVIRDYIESLWGSGTKYPEQKHYLRLRPIDHAEPPKQRTRERMPNRDLQREVIDRDGYRCRFCGLPVIPVEVRTAIHTAYPDAVPWGSKNADQHAAFQTLWLQFDHVRPHCLGGDSSISNLVITCGGCNYGKSYRHIDKHGLIDPMERPPIISSWRGLTQFLSGLTS